MGGILNLLNPFHVSIINSLAKLRIEVLINNVPSC
jgi:hypothetical protein